jgi:hypothetical protein
MPWSYPGQMFDRALTPLKGWPSQTALDFDAPLSTNVNINSTNSPPQSGMCVHNTAAGFEMGANLTKMAIFLWPSHSDFDVSNPGVPAGTVLGGTTANPPGWVPWRPTGKLVGLVATGGYELETTEFDTAQTYVINQTLRAVTTPPTAPTSDCPPAVAVGGTAVPPGSEPASGGAESPLLPALSTFNASSANTTSPMAIAPPTAEWCTTLVDPARPRKSCW